MERNRNSFDEVPDAPPKSSQKMEKKQPLK